MLWAQSARCRAWHAASRFKARAGKHMSASESQQHWQKAYGARASDGLSWYQEKPKVSLALIAATGIVPPAPIIDMGGGASNLVDYLIVAGHTYITVLDIAEASLAAAQQRLGANAEAVSWLAADATDWTPLRRYDIWHDCEVFHFLTQTAARRAYVARLEAALAAGGQAIFATFALDGPARCSGLDVMRYDSASLGCELGPGFKLAESRADIHMTPSSMTQKFHYSRFARS